MDRELISNQLAVTVSELESLLKKMKTNERTGGTVPIKVCVTTTKYRVWEMNLEKL